MRSWRIGSAFGIGVFVHWSFFLVVLFAIYNYWDGTYFSAVYGVSLVLALFGCVVLHEFGHALTARQFGIPTRDITLYPIGGIARLERMSEKPWEELLITIAGPAVNVVIAVLLAFPAYISIQEKIAAGATVEQVLMGRNLLLHLAVVNVFLALFNMIPAFPMDGGRILRALLATSMSYGQATEVAVLLGRILAVPMGIYGALNGMPALVLIPFFIWPAGSLELMAVRHREGLRQARAMKVLPAMPEILDVIPAPDQDVYTNSVWDRDAGAWILWRDGRPYIVDRDAPHVPPPSLN